MALMLGRKPGEGIVILDEEGREIHVKVVKSENSGLKLRIDAPPAFKILREEIYQGNNS